MNLNLLQSLMIGFASGLTQMLPVSAEAHRTVLRILCGVDKEDAVFRLLVHIACLIAVSSYYQSELRALGKAKQLMRIPPKRRRKPLNPADANTVQLLRSGAVVLMICRVLTMGLASVQDRLNLLPAGLIATGILLFIPTIVRSGNMNSRNMPRINGLLMGLGGGVGGIGGFSPVGCAMALGQWQGVDRNYAMKFAHLLLLPGLGCQIAADLLAIVTGGAEPFSFGGLMTALAGAVAAGFASQLGLRLMTSIGKRNGFSAFAYYNWGLALLCFALFLSI